LTGAAMAAGGVSAGLPLAGAAWYAAGNALLMLFYGAVGLVAGQLAQSARTGYLIGLVALAASYLVRALVDGLGWEAVWASPLGWTAEVRPFADPRPWPLAAFAVGAVVLSGAAVLLARRRDLGAGVVPARRGPALGRRGLGTAAGLAWRLNRGVVLAWTVLAVVWAGVFGALTQEMADLVDANPAMLEALGVERGSDVVRSEEHTSELQSREKLVCRLLLEKKKEPASELGWFQINGRYAEGRGVPAAVATV